MSMIDDASDETKDAIKEARERAERDHQTDSGSEESGSEDVGSEDSTDAHDIGGEPVSNLE